MVDRSMPPSGYILFTEELYKQVQDDLDPELVEYLEENFDFQEGFVRSSHEMNPKEIKDLFIPNSIRKRKVSGHYLEQLLDVAIDVVDRYKPREKSKTPFWARKAPTDKEIIEENRNKISISNSLSAQDIYDSIKKNTFGFVYFIKNQDIYKIGITQNLLQRLDQLKPDEVLNIVRCNNFEELEKILHKSFKENRIPQTEYFRLTASQVEEVHQLMTTKANF